MKAKKEKIRLFDAHCHVNFGVYGDDTEAVVQRARSQGIGLIAVGARFETSLTACGCADLHDNVWAIIGMHPTHIYPSFADEAEGDDGRQEIFAPDKYRQLAKKNTKVVGIGECGLDYFHLPEGVAVEELKRRQADVFRQHLDLALELDLPVMVHTRDGKGAALSSHQDVLAILEEYAWAGRGLRGDIHCFSGRWADAERYLKFGFHLSFTGNLTYPPRSAEKISGETLENIALKTPLDRILLETDAPYLTPAPHRGERNEPSYVQFVADKLAAIKGIPVEEVERQTTANVRKLFGIRA